jgi:hypothetical protein
MNHDILTLIVIGVGLVLLMVSHVIILVGVGMLGCWHGAY